MSHEADVGQFGAAVDEHDVCGLDVSVRQSLAVEILEGARKLAADFERVVERERAVAVELLVAAQRARHVVRWVNMDTGAGVVRQFHDVVIERRRLRATADVENVHEPRVIARDGLVIQNPFKLPDEGAFVLEILAPHDLDGAESPRERTCEPYFPVGAFPNARQNLQVGNERRRIGGTAGSAVPEGGCAGER